MAQQKSDATITHFPLNDQEYEVVKLGEAFNFGRWDIANSRTARPLETIPHTVTPAESAAKLGVDGYFEVEEEPLNGSTIQKTFVVKVPRNLGLKGHEQMEYIKIYLAGFIMTIAVSEIEDKHVFPNYKIGIEVKALFEKALRPVQDEEAAVPAGPDMHSFRYIYIHRILDSSIRDIRNDEEARMNIGALINSIEVHCFDTNYAPDSAHTFVTVTEVRIHFYQTDAFRRGGSFIPLPKRLLGSKSIINPQNKDNMCFKYALLIGLLLKRYEVTRSIRANLRDPATIIKYAEKINNITFNGVDSYPVQPTKQFFTKFDKENPDIHLNIYVPTESNEVSLITPIFISKNAQGTVVDLLFWTLEEQGHFACISKLSGILRNRTKKTSKKFVCTYCGDVYFNSEKLYNEHFAKFHPDATHDFVCEKCLNIFTSKEEYEWHQTMCMITDTNYRPVILPETEKKIEWEEPMNQYLIPLPTYLVADFESVLSPISEQVGKKSERIHKHLCCAFAIRTVSIYPDLNKFYIYVGKSTEDTMENFCQQIIHFSTFAYNYMLKTPQVEIKINEKQENEYQKQRRCYICKRVFTKMNTKVRDHDHITGEYLGAACNNCNLKRQPVRYFLPLVFHNAKGYDLHYIMSEITKRQYGCTFGGIPNSSEKLLTFKVAHENMYPIQIIDSLQFLLKSLESLVEIRKKTIADFKVGFPFFTEFFKEKLEYSDKQISTILKKNEFPYEWLSTFERLDAPIEELPLKDRSVLADLPSVKTVKDYLSVYLACDVLQLADIVDAERKGLLESHGIDMLRCYGAAGYSWKAMLYFNKLHNGYTFDCILDTNMLCFIYKSIRGGSSFISHRYYKADANHAILYLDANNLYGWSMSQPLPYADFEWVEQEGIDHLNRSPQSEVIDLIHACHEKGKGMILEVDLDYSDERVQWLTADYPLAPEKATVPAEDLSPFSKEMNKKLGVKHNSSQTYLLQTVKNKYHYNVYSKNLALYLSLGVKLLKIHRILLFSEAPVLKDYIALNTKIRDHATKIGDFAGRERAKLMNNSIYGKTYENPMKYSTLVMTSSANEAVRTQSKPGFVKNVFVSGDFTIADVKHAEVKYDKPLYLGAIITELAKYHMFDMYFNHVIPFWGRKRTQLLFTDTDSLMIGIETKDLWRDIHRFNELHNNLIEEPGNPHNGEIGYFKSETGTKPIDEFVGLRAKMYSYVMKDEKEGHCKAKGVGKDAMRLIKHENYLKCLNEQTRDEVEMTGIRSVKHMLYTTKIHKIGLSCNDPKRFICEDNIHTLPYGHWLTKK